MRWVIYLAIAAAAVIAVAAAVCAVGGPDGRSAASTGGGPHDRAYRHHPGGDDRPRDRDAGRAASHPCTDADPPAGGHGHAAPGRYA